MYTIVHTVNASSTERFDNKVSQTGRFIAAQNNYARFLRSINRRKTEDYNTKSITNFHSHRLDNITKPLSDSSFVIRLLPSKSSTLYTSCNCCSPKSSKPNKLLHAHKLFSTYTTYYPILHYSIFGWHCNIFIVQRKTRQGVWSLVDEPNKFEIVIGGKKTGKS